MKKILSTLFTLLFVFAVGGNAIADSNSVSPTDLSNCDSSYIEKIMENEYGIDSSELDYYIRAYNNLYQENTCEFISSNSTLTLEKKQLEDDLKGIDINSETFNDYFKSVKWIQRNNEISLSIQPNSLLLSSDCSSGNLLMARAAHAFRLLSQRYSRDPRWRNEASLSAQFHCHVIFAGGAKTPWNIEPHRTESNLFIVILRGCNP